jgi:hypothetical protein
MVNIANVLGEKNKEILVYNNMNKYIMRHKLISCILIIVVILFPGYVFSQHKQINILSLGAIADGKTYNTTIIQNAINNVSTLGGGMVIIPSGHFLTSVIHMKSNVDLHLEKNAFLLGSTKRIDYGHSDASALIVAKGAHNIAITGQGIIDGQGDDLLKNIYIMLNAGTLKDAEWKMYNPWHQMRPEERNRPKIIAFENCNNIQVKGIELKNGLDWIEEYKNCSDLIIDSIKVESNTFWNNDGIDLVDCKNVKVLHSFFNVDDDGICLKSVDRNSCCENIYIADCTVRSSASAVKFGTDSRGGFKNITIRDIKVYDTYRSAIAIECVDGGTADNIDVRNITATNTGNAIFMRLGHRNKDALVSTLQNVYIGNMQVTVPNTKPDKGYPMEGPVLKYPHNVFPSSITGIPGHPVKNITIENIAIQYEGGGSDKVADFSIDSLSKVPECVNAYPEFSMFGELPAWGLYVRHVDSLRMKNIRLSYQKFDYRPSCIFDDVNRLQMNDVTIPSAKELLVLIFDKVINLSMKQMHLPVDNNKAIRIIKQ